MPKLPVVKVDSDDGDTCFYTCPHCKRRTHSEFDKWVGVYSERNGRYTLVCPRCGKKSRHPDDK